MKFTPKLIVTLLGLIALTSCSKPHNSKQAIHSELKHLVNLELDTSKFVVLTDSVHNTEGAFDLDYTWYANIRFDKDYFENVKKTIRSSANFNTITNEYDKKWFSIDTSKIKGVWHSDSVFLEYIQKPKGFKSESIYLSIDTTSRELNLRLIHL
ncbi:hypothetical protein NAT51_13745 [Flavobacterium amniphilum]|uniref:hypothetical protein n=1 Tax=Flavobacterium amniphilum TaxID=1834035 RepID=UPI00202A6B85|nr:hypothetical protein [Flavobacterium amniphilum]MCL9806594.1 hypothetical protein [Flavobacterium amniphilum]